MTRLLGVDLGTRRIGLALGDTDTGSVVPLATISRSSVERDGRTVAKIVDEQRVDELVVGLPLAWRDERLTTEDAISRVGRPSRGRSGGPPSPAARRSHRARLDRLAAAAIVQAELDARLARANGDRE